MSMKKAIIIGATSGLGLEVAKQLLAAGWQLGIAGRREPELLSFQQQSPEKIAIQSLDVMHDDAPEKLEQLIAKVGGMDLFFLASGVGLQNPDLHLAKELQIVETNVVGFTRMVTTAYHFFGQQGFGHLAVISSVAGTRGIGASASYSSSKCFQSTYIDSLEQLAHSQKLNIHFTDIRPGFVETAILSSEKKYPLLMTVEYAGKGIVKALERKKRIAIIDWRYAVLVFLMRAIPRCIWKRLPIQN